jgi:hypothetical protein
MLLPFVDTTLILTIWEQNWDSFVVNKCKEFNNGITITINMRFKFTGLLTLIILIAIFIGTTLLTSANEEGYGDMLTGGNECLSCHTHEYNPGVGIGYNSIQIGDSPATIHFKVQVDMTNIPDRSEKYGVMLVTPSNENLSEDGWIIISDPKGNELPKNYVEMASHDSSLLQWALRNSPGHYMINVIILYGSQDKEFYYAHNETIDITAPKPNNPPQLSNPGRSLLPDGKTYDFEVTYTDLDGDFPDNITVNISGLGSFEMEPKPAQFYNYTEGVTFFHFVVLSEDQYSYHFSAYDGEIWNSTVNSDFNAYEEEIEEVNFRPLVFGIIVALVVVCAVYILRSR